MNIKSYLREYPVTFSLIAITVVMFLVEMMKGGSQQIEVLYHLGALTRSGVQTGQWWRLITPIFLHIGFQHILFNMLTLLVFGFYIEPFLGSWRFLSVYLLGGIYGNLVSFAFQSETTISAGASSSIFALFGIFVLMRRSLVNNSQYHYLSTQIVGLAVFNFVFDVIDNFAGGSIGLLAHLGGFIGGYFLSIILGSPQAANYPSWQRILAALFFVASSIGLYLFGMGRALV
ncbi:rhomboid family intramembrane serine protease [Xylocopilactobacillus apicola]|uniref:Rhomboid family intramembrane serine protease n=1 Tax=Xylocopilactobacillus apicola TaxID=2932184 RepID=A0AAU9DER3_9LACO|nr:rhomboid family intramembrane serine protease [Xylocopilactobacillus apicola]BDR58395.1 rhomboid family intramembrane serine protease [Xylocopilactobacillus apicola]